MKDQQKSELAPASNLPDKPDRSFTARLLKAQDDERRRIGRELHDSVGQYLVALKMNLGRLHTKLGAKADHEIGEAERMLEEALTEVRTVSHLLHPPNLELLGLRSSLLWYVDGFQKRSNIKTSTDIPESLPRLTPEAETALFRVAQECLTNARRHAQASHVALRMAVDDQWFQLEVTDNGKGFSDLENCRQGVGILGMQERLGELGGSLRVESGKGKGSSVIATIPLEPSRLAQPATEVLSQPAPAPNGNRARILLVDDHALTRRGVRSLLETQSDFEVCGEAGTAKEATERAKELRPDIVILDLQLPDGDGWGVIRSIRKAEFDAKFIIFSHHDGSYVQRSAKNAKCQGAISKASPPTDLISAIRAAIAGDTYFRPETFSAVSR